MIAATAIIYGSRIFFTNSKAQTVMMAINAVIMSTMLRVAITTTAPTNAPITAAVIPSTKVFTDWFFAIFLKYGAGITVNK